MSPAVVTYLRGLPSGATGRPYDGSGIPKPLAEWATSDTIYVIAYGSGSCPPLPTNVRATGAHRMIVTTKELVPTGDGACTSDLAPTTSEVRLPSKIDKGAPLDVDIDGTVTTLPPR